jgi:hypothetical protein
MTEIRLPVSAFVRGKGNSKIRRGGSARNGNSGPVGSKARFYALRAFRKVLGHGGLGKLMRLNASKGYHYFGS